MWRTAVRMMVAWLCAGMVALHGGSSLAAGPARHAQQMETPSGPVLVESLCDHGPGCADRPALVVLGGSRGLGSPAYDEMGRRFDAAGLAVFLVHVLSREDLRILASAGSTHIRKAHAQVRMADWVASVRGVTASLAKPDPADPRQRRRPVGLMGISLGATIAAAVPRPESSPDAMVLVAGGAMPAALRGPLLLIWGGDDRVFPLRHGYAIERAGRESGHPVRLHVHPGEGHDFFVRPGWAAAGQAHRQAAEFLRAHLAR